MRKRVWSGASQSGWIAMSRVLPAFVFLALWATSAAAVPIAAPNTEGLKVFASGGEVVATFQGSTASYSNDLFLDNGDNDFTNDILLFNNKSTPVGTSLSLGTFAAGTELVFRLYVRNTGYSFFSGPDGRNPDGHAHARVQSAWQAGTTLVSFEDLYNGRFDFNDLSFSFTNTQGSNLPAVPLPAAATLLLAAIGCLAIVRRSARA